MLRRLCVPFVLPMALAAQQVLEGAEPNATLATATPLACGAEALGTLTSAADADWYTLTLTATSDVYLATGPGAGSQVGDTMLTLLDATGAPLWFNDNGVRCGNWSQLLCKGLVAGTYVVAVERGPNGAASGSYALDVRCTAPAALATPAIVNEGLENNDPRTGGTATLVALPARCNGQIGTVGIAGDWDFWRFTLANETFVQLRVGGTATHPQTPRLDDPVLYVYDTATPPNVVAGPFFGSDFATFDATVDVRLPAGSWQVGIRGWVGSVAGRYYLDLHGSTGASVATGAGGCGGRVLAAGTSNSGPGAPLVIERPTIGTTWSLVGQSLGANGIALHVVGFAPVLLDLTPFGAPGCTLEVDYVAVLPQLADAAGSARFVTPLAEAPSLLGASLVSQAAVLDFANPLGITLSNRVTATVGN